MSVQDVDALLDEKSGLFVFLPALNYIVLYSMGVEPSLPNIKHNGVFLLFGAITLLMGAYMYNYTIGHPDESPKPLEWVYLISLVSIVVSYAHTSVELSIIATVEEMISVILLFASLSFIFILSTHIFIDKFADNYSREF
ncbi:hypothetical protein [Natranaeroarchaeum aerophilus]|uniref:Uncharacterized protein n=1 Tax=Natranaeroarchaeum aerophilus TaxID=2917711 RepID=A0AAE3FP48_9EURY|nr:hypothetical protein [Natranaeroarchaeum aerophilus]MCL9812505.1 hypothetical protein [Natranaeroarchaeum aerophilus]